MNSVRATQLTAAIFTGLFTGLMFTFQVVIQRMLATLSASEYTRIMQGLIRGADDPPLVPAMVIIAVVAPVVALVQLRHERESAAFRYTLTGWLAFTVGVLVVTVGFNAPINNMIMKWDAQSPPADWMQMRDRWNSLNVIRTPMSGIAFVCFLLSLIAPPSRGSR